MLGVLVGSGALAKVLGVVLFKESLYLRDIARIAGISPSEAKRELDKLVSVGVLLSRRKGNLRIFTLNSDCPFLGELKGLYLKTNGVFSMLRRALSRKGVAGAFVYGSMANGSYSDRSDLDLLVVGDISEDELERVLFSIQKETSREINYILWTEGELRKKLVEKSGFARSLAKREKVWIKGGRDGLKGPAKKRHD